MIRVIAMIPTWNEAENIGPLLDAILAADSRMEALVVDDHSPDGTWRIVEERSKSDPRVHLLHRTSGRGRGLAGLAGFREAVALGADWVLEMDADFSHDPRWIPSFLARMDDADVVIGSRLAPGGGEEGRSPVRRWITLAANAYIRAMLGLPVRDATSGYRLFSRRSLASLPWDAMRATGPEVVQEVLLAVHARGFRIVEVPILFVDRRAGQSTFNARIMLRSLGAVARLRMKPGALVPAAEEKLTGLPSAVSVPASWAYRLGRTAHRAWRLGMAGAHRLPAPIVCVGNLTVGGTGKTPFARMLAQQVQAMGFKPAILSRGYRARQTPREPLIVSDGQKLPAGADEAGDEARWLAERLPGVPVIVHPNRAAAGKAAIERLKADLLILDDGFQHDALARDLDIVLWDLRDRPSRMRLLPVGRLREGLGALRRASAIVLTHGEYLEGVDRVAWTESIVFELKRHAPQVPVFEVATQIEGWARVGSESETGECPPWPWEGRRVIAVSGLARPGGFTRTLAAARAQVVHHFTYPDHHAYTTANAAQWRDALKRLQAGFILTTEKDAVKLRGMEPDLPILAVRIAMRMREPEPWSAWIGTCLAKGGE